MQPGWRRRLTKGSLAGMLALLGLAMLVVAVWAEYSGPNRTTRVRQRNPQNDRWVCTRNNPPATCTLQNPNNPCPDAGGSHPSVGQQLAWCGWVADNCGCNEAYTTVTVNAPPAAVSGAFVCSTPGANGWCRSGAGIDFSAQEPLSGQVINRIEGNLGGGGDLTLYAPGTASNNINCGYRNEAEGSLLMRRIRASKMVE